MQDDQTSVSEGVSSEGISSDFCLFSHFSTLPVCSCVNSTYNCAFQSLTSSCRIGRRRQTATVGLLATHHRPHPDHRRNPPGNRTNHMTNSFHSELEDRQKSVDVMDKHTQHHSETCLQSPRLAFCAKSGVYRNTNTLTHK